MIKSTLTLILLIISFQIMALHDVALVDGAGNPVDTAWIFETYSIIGTFETVGGTANSMGWMDLDRDGHFNPAVDFAALGLRTVTDGQGDQYGYFPDPAADGQLNMTYEMKNVMAFEGLYVNAYEENGVTDTVSYEIKYREEDKVSGYKGFIYLADGCPAYRMRVAIAIRGAEANDPANWFGNGRPVAYTHCAPNGSFEVYFPDYVASPGTEVGWSIDNTMQLYGCPWRDSNNEPAGEYLPDFQQGVVQDVVINMECGSCSDVQVQAQYKNTKINQRHIQFGENQKVTINFLSAGNAQIQIFNSKGILLSETDMGNVKSGSQKSLNLSTLGKGTFFIKVKINNEISMVERVIIR